MNENISKVITIEKEIEKQSEQISARDYKFYHLPRLLQTAKLMHKHAPECENCKNFIEEIATFVPETAALLNGNFAAKNKFEKQTELWLNHLLKKHEYRIKGYQMSLITFYCLLAGTITGVSVAAIAGFEILRFTVLAGWAVGLIIGTIWGNRVEKKLKHEEKLL